MALRIIAVALTGNLTAATLQAALREASATPAPFGLLVDARPMSAYEPEARQEFVAWNRAHRDRITGVAVITTRLLWRSVIAAMGLASGQALRAFEDETEARRWLESTA